MLRISPFFIGLMMLSACMEEEAGEPVVHPPALDEVAWDAAARHDFIAEAAAARARCVASEERPGGELRITVYDERGLVASQVQGDEEQAELLRRDAEGVPEGRLAVSDETVQVMRYDDEDDLIGISDLAEGSDAAWAISQETDAEGFLRSMRLESPDGQVTTRSFNRCEDVIREEGPDGRVTRTRWTYQPASCLPLRRVDVGDGVRIETSFDPLGLPIERLQAGFAFEVVWVCEGL